MKSHIPIVCVSIMACALTSGLININFQHNLHLPKELTNKTTIVAESLVNLHLAKIYDIYLTDDVTTDYQFRDTIELFDQANKGDVINLHLAGVGGNVDTVLLLINHMKSTRAKVVAIVEAPAYSGHAYLALAADELVMRPFTYLLMHTTSGYGFDCSTVQGTDRTHPKSEVCQIMLDAHIANTNKVIDNLNWLTTDEKQQIESGTTVIITSDQINAREQESKRPQQTKDNK